MPSQHSFQVRIGDIDTSEWPCADDKLGRNQEIRNLTPLILNAQSPLVMGLDSPWGGGKTTFIEMWEQYLKHEGHRCLVLNAWKNDFADDPLLSLLAQINQWVSPDMKDTWEKVKKYTSILVKKLPMTIGKQISPAGFNLGEIAKDLGEALSENPEQHLIELHQETLNSMNIFRESLKEILASQSDEQENFVIFIDELDRCNPHYAVAMLERIKHLFDIEGLVFVLAINTEQLATGFQGVYGPNFDGRGYLRRFIDFDYRLAKTRLKKYIDAKFNSPFIQSLAEERGFTRRIGEASAALEFFSRRFEYQPRDANQLITRVKIMMLSVSGSRDFQPLLAVCLLVLRLENYALYKKFVESPLNANDVIECLIGVTPDSDNFPTGFSSYAGTIIGCNKRGVDSVMDKWRERIEKENNDDSVVSLEVKNLINIASSLAVDGDGRENLKTTHEQIEFANGFIL